MKIGKSIMREQREEWNVHRYEHDISNPTNPLPGALHPWPFCGAFFLDGRCSVNTYNAHIDDCMGGLTMTGH